MCARARSSASPGGTSTTWSSGSASDRSTGISLSRSNATARSCFRASGADAALALARANATMDFERLCFLGFVWTHPAPPRSSPRPPCPVPRGGGDRPRWRRALLQQGASRVVERLRHELIDPSGAQALPAVCRTPPGHGLQHHQVFGRGDGNELSAQRERSGEFQVVRRSRISSAFAMRRFSAHRRTSSGLPRRCSVGFTASCYTPEASGGLSAIMASDSGRGGETGRRTGLKIPGLPKGRAGSIPAPGTSN